MPPSLAVLKSNFKETMVSSAAIDPICVMNKKNKPAKEEWRLRARTAIGLKCFHAGEEISSYLLHFV